MSVFFIAGHKFGGPGMQWTTKARKMRKARKRIDEALVIQTPFVISGDSFSKKTKRNKSNFGFRIANLFSW
jgi:hypothetical protein